MIDGDLVGKRPRGPALDRGREPSRRRSVHRSDSGLVGSNPNTTSGLFPRATELFDRVGALSLSLSRGRDLSGPEIQNTSRV